MRKKLLICGFLSVLAIALILPMSACSNSQPKDDNRFVQLLKMWPASAKEAIICVMIDYKAIAAANGYSLVDPALTYERFIELQQQIRNGDNLAIGSIMTIGSDYTGHGRNMYNTNIRKFNVGYDVTSIDAEISFDIVQSVIDFTPDDSLKTQSFKVGAIGRFNPELTSELFTTQEAWPDWTKANYSSENYNNSTIFSWGDSSITHPRDSSFMPPHLDMQGKARPLAITNNELFVANSVDTIKSMIDSSSNPSLSKINSPEYVKAANGMNKLGAFAGVIGRDSIVNHNDKNPVAYYAGPNLKKFLVFASGIGKDEKGYYTALVLVHENNEQAKANIELLKKRIETTTQQSALIDPYADIKIGTPWKEIILDTDIRSEGPVLLAKLYTADNYVLWFRWVTNFDNLVPHDE